MSVSAEIYLVVSLMFAVFAAVAAVGTSIVLGVGFERLRAGFEVVRKQTGFFAEAIHKLDHKTKDLDEKSGKLEEVVSTMRDTVHRVDQQTGFFADAIQGLEQKIEDQKSRPVSQEQTVSGTEPEKPAEDLNLPHQSWITASSMDMDAPDAEKLLEGACMLDYLARQEEVHAEEIRPSELAQLPAEQPLIAACDPKTKSGLSQFLGSYFKGEDRTDGQKIVYH